MVEIVRKGWHPNHYPANTDGIGSHGFIFYDADRPVSSAFGAVEGGKLRAPARTCARAIAADAHALAVAVRLDDSTIAVLDRDGSFPVERVHEAFGIVEEKPAPAIEPDLVVVESPKQSSGKKR